MHEGNRQQQLHITHQLKAAPQWLAQGVSRPKSIGFEPAHCSNTAGEEIIDKRQLLGVAVTVAIAYLATQHHRIRGIQRHEGLVLVGEFIEREVAARHRQLTGNPIQHTTIGEDATITVIARPAGSQEKLQEAVAVVLLKLQYFL